MRLASHDTVFIPEVNTHHAAGDDAIDGENIRPGSPADQLAARRHFGLKDSEFSVVLLGKDGTEIRRWSSPVSLDELTTQINANSESEMASR